MARRSTKGGITAPARRPLKIFAVDPMMGRTFGNRALINVVNESLTPGPVGARMAIVDYDGNTQRYCTPIDLDHSAVLMQGGLDPSESDPRFHQQMVYGVAMKTVENFDRALGRRIRLGTAKHSKLRLFPHAFFGANAFYQRSLNAVLFGYFRADKTNPGENLPGQVVFACLSHDVIAHEVTHKLVDQLRPLFLEPSNEDVLAFHEGFSDIVALFQHFSFPDVVRDQIAKTRSDLTTAAPLVELARQFGYATGTGRSLRSAIDQKPDPSLYESLTEPHLRGSILVAAVFDGFQKVYRRRTYDLIRIATGGSGVLPGGDLHPDLVSRIAGEASKTAQRVLDMCIRAFDYLPPVDITFGDFLRALITADYELIPDDELNLRGAMIEAFRLRGIYPSGVVSLAEESLLWETGKNLPSLPLRATGLIQELFFSAVLDVDDGPEPIDSDTPTSSEARELRNYYSNLSSSNNNQDSDDRDSESSNVNTTMAVSLQGYAKNNALALGLDPALNVQVRGFHPVFRVAPNGKLVIELVVQFAQKDESNVVRHGGLPFRGGTTLISSADGTVRYIVDKPMPSAGLGGERMLAAQRRWARQEAYVRACDANDPTLPYLSPSDYNGRMLRLMNLARLHAG